MHMLSSLLLLVGLALVGASFLPLGLIMLAGGWAVFKKS